LPANRAVAFSLFPLFNAIITKVMIALEDGGFLGLTVANSTIQELEFRDLQVYDSALQIVIIADTVYTSSEKGILIV